MNLQEMIAAISRRVDDAVSPADAVEWLNSGKNRMATAVDANFPDLVATDLLSTFVFDSKYHEGPVLYACASFKEQDVALQEVRNFMEKFEGLKREFMRSYMVPPRYRDDRISQQFRATAGQTAFLITKNGYDPNYGDATVYVNDILVQYTTTPDLGNLITLVTPASLNDYVTIIWEEHMDLLNPPYNWMTW